MFHKQEKKVAIIEGMHCEHCAKKVESALLALDGVDKVKINLKKKEVTVLLSGPVQDDLIKEQIETLDYTVLEIK